jgi:hypothetical protein
MFKTGVDICFNEINVVLCAAEPEFGFVPANGFDILFPDLSRKNFQVFPAFKVDETVGTILEIEIEFFLFVSNMK